MNAFNTSTSFSSLTSIEYLIFPPFVVLPFFFFSFPCPVVVTGAVEGSQSVKEAHRGLMRTVLPACLESRTVSLAFVWECVHMCGSQN